ncbi:hypothetical protein ACOMHN_007004 [Nucella lapillus]
MKLELSCECQPGHKYTKRFGGDQARCEPCKANEAVSSDGWECKVCADGSNSETCTCQATNTITAERAINGQWVNQGPPQKDQCVLCEGSAVPNAQKDRCIRCSDDLNLGFTSCPAPCPENQKEGTDNTQSRYLEAHLRAAYAMCTNSKYKNATACQVVANLCALTLYNERQGRICNFIRNTLPPGTPYQILYYSDDSDDIIGANDIPDSYTFNPPVTIPLEAAVHTLDGRYLGNKPLTDGLLQLCDTTETVANAAYIFGTYFSHSCKIKAKGLWDTVKHPLLFYDIYLKYTDQGQARLYKIPLQILNVRDTGDKLINEDEVKDWRITRRMFLVDNQMTIPSATGSAEGTGTEQVAQYVRYAKDITLNIDLQSETSDGKIELPYFTVNYHEVSLQQANEGASVEISFKTTYSMSWSLYQRNFRIAVGTLSSLTAVYAAFRSWVWSKRAGRQAIDFAALVNLLFYLAAALSNIFFVITFCIAFYWFIFFKRQDVVYLVHPDEVVRQDVVYLVHPDGVVVREWKGLLIGAFVLSCHRTTPHHTTPHQINYSLSVCVCPQRQDVVYLVHPDGVVRQDVVYLVHPDGVVVREWEGLLIGAFVLSCLGMVHKVVMQCSADIFLIDWERPRGVHKGQDGKQLSEVPVSIWRTYFVANEWNEIQAMRKISANLQLLKEM